MEFVKFGRDDIDDLLFEKRNKSYGAYFLRKRYKRNINIAMAITIGAFLLLVSIPVIQRYFMSDTDVKKPLKTVDVTALVAPPPLDETKPPPPPNLPPPPPKTIKFTPPVIKPDEEVKPEEEPPKQEEMKEVAPAASTNIDPNAAVNFNDAPVAVVEAPVQKPQMFVEQMPQFPGGEEALHQYLQNHIKYPNLATENKISGTVVLQFVVGTDGSISDIKTLRGLEGGCTEEAIRVVRGMPKWTPGNNNGLAVPVYFNLPIVFQLQE
jgi:periplasmic protein TonB